MQRITYLLDATQIGNYTTQMGYDTVSSVSIANALFSKVQQRVLALIFGEPERSFYTSEIVRRIGSGTGAVMRELARLHGSGLVSVVRIGNQTHYKANPQAPVFEELRNLVAKTVGVAGPIKNALAPLAETVDAAFIYGSVAKGTDTAESDIDLMVVGDDLDYSRLYSAVSNAEEALHRKVHPTFLSRADWRRKSSRRGSVIGKIGALPKIFVLGSESALRP
jgi:predicted nucleotidyltransferase